MRSPFASLNWGVHQSDSARFLVAHTVGGYYDDSSYLYQHKPECFISLSSAVQAAFKLSCNSLSRRAELLMDMLDADDWEISGMFTEPFTNIFQIQTFHNESPNPIQLSLIGYLQEVWAELSQLEIGEVQTWEDYLKIRNRKLSTVQKNFIDQSFENSEFPHLNMIEILKCGLNYQDGNGESGDDEIVTIWKLPDEVQEDSV
jgi:hypothetical protein